MRGTGEGVRRMRLRVLSSTVLAAAVGVVLPAAPAAAVPAPSPRPAPAAVGMEPYLTEVAATAPSGRVRLWKFFDRNLQVYGAEDLGGAARGGPDQWHGPVNGEERQVVLVRGTDDAVWWRSRVSRYDMYVPGSWYRGPWSAWVSLGGRTTHRPAFDAERLLVRGTDGALWQRILVGTAWSPWRRVGAPFSGAPAVHAGRAYATDAAGHVVTASKQPTGILWTGWRRLPALPGGRSVAGEVDVDAGVVTVRAGDGSCWSGVDAADPTSAWAECGAGRASGIARTAHHEFPGTYVHYFAYAGNGDLQARLVSGTAAPTPWTTFAHP